MAAPRSNIVCPLHRWTYDLHGQLIGAPHFDQDPCLNLRNYPLQRWNGLLFEANGYDVSADLGALSSRPEFDFSGFVFDRAVMHECDYNWKTFIEVYLEDYHVGPFHPGLRPLRHLRRPALGIRGQPLGADGGRARPLAIAPGSPTYRRWHEAVLQFSGGEPPPHGAIWLTLYPNIMLEWYPHVLVVSTV